MPAKIFARIRVRRGLYSDLPNPLNGSEFGHVIDEQRLFIGNGAVSDGAPAAGNTEILTQYSNNVDIITHIYESNTPVIAQTGSSPSSPVVRTLQQCLDDRVSIKDFGALGDGSNDDSAAWNRAVTQLYCSPPGGPGLAVGELAQVTRRTLFLPAGVYNVKSNMLLMPPHMRIVGEGKNASLIQMDTSSTLDHLFRTCDSLAQTGSNIGANSAELPNDIVCEDVGFARPAAVVGPVGRIERAYNMYFHRCSFYAGWTQVASALAATATSSGTTLNFTSLPSGVAVGQMVTDLTNTTGGVIPTSATVSSFANTVAYVTTAATSSGTTLTFLHTTGIAAGQIVTDTTGSGRIPANTTVISTTLTTVLISNAVTGGGVLLGDSINFAAIVVLSTGVTGSGVALNDTIAFNAAPNTNIFDVSKLGSGTTMTNFKFDQCEMSGYYDVFTLSGASGVTDIEFLEGWFHDAYRGVYFNTAAKNAKVIGSQFVNLHDRGIYADTASTKIRSIGNSFVNVGIINNVNPVEFDATTTDCTSVSESFDTVITGGSTLADNTSTTAVIMNNQGFGQFQNVVYSSRIGPVELLANQSSPVTTGITFPLQAATGIFIDYVLIRGDDFRIGQMKIVGDGSTVVYLYDSSFENDISNVVFTAQISGSTVVVYYTSDTIGYLPILYYTFRYFNFLLPGSLNTGELIFSQTRNSGLIAGVL